MHSSGVAATSAPYSFRQYLSRSTDEEPFSARKASWPSEATNRPLVAVGFCQAVERYVEVQDLVDGEFSRTESRSKGGPVTERYWSSEDGKTFADAEDTGGASQVRFAQNVRLVVWDLDE